MSAPPADAVAEEVLGSPKYRHLDPDLVRFVAEKEAAAHPRLKEAVKAARSRLHQVAGAYRDGPAPYDAWLADLRGSAADPAAFRAARRAVMTSHASTRERLPALDGFYRELLGPLAPVRSVLDLGCGLNPLAIPEMPLAPGAEYVACDVDLDLLRFLSAWLPLAGVSGRAVPCNLARSCPEDEVDVALALKLLPPLEQIERGAGLRLLRSVRARAIVVSFPGQSLSGRKRGMGTHYAGRFLDSLSGERWSVRRLDFPAEVAFVLTG